ncbi:Plug domain-containing protein [Roseivirga misakiensis]|uniref:TonB-dependent receptor plug domain-containing protein n=1 Tax=Roseivirga misakiensis TaxID=1563681 RepID=A0A1E5T5L3_9BACT|nr:Plug domain-containing protein [Roseivirga misakiensis]OEK06665.1 hypothetical protein BFP71_03090 [Roseivirga misakiensis]
MNYMKHTLIICLISSIAFSLSAQDNKFQNWLKDFAQYQTELPTEKVFLHLDKSEYTLGETIWMKSYLVAGSGHIPSPFSKNLYVELVNEDGDIKERLNLRSEEGFAKASLAIQKSLEPGYYYLRSYTNWMKNQEQEYFFNKKIKIQSLKENIQIKEQKRDRQLQVSFYPEGGDMINGVAGKIAFEVEGMTSDQLPVSGKVYNRNDEEVAGFKTSHEGKGLFPLLPTEDGYYAKIDGVDAVFDLPEVKQTGVALSVNNQGDTFMNILLKTGAPSTDSYYLLVHTRGYITFASEVKMKGMRGMSRVDKKTLPDGISHITLLDASMNPVAERLAFINNDKQLNLNVSTTSPNYDTRELASIDLAVTDSEGNPVQGSFSMSVFDANLVQNDQIDYNIRAHMLLGSDLKGYIKNPSQYLKNDSDTKQNVDLLMMVNGWRRFDWEKIGKPISDPAYSFETGLSLVGSVTKKGGSKIKNGRVLLINPSEETVLPRFSETDELGNFKFEELVYYDTTELTLQGFQKDRVKNVNFRIEEGYEQLGLKRFNVNPSADNPARISALKKQAITSIFIDSTYRRENGIIYLDDVYVTASKQEERNRTLNSQYGKGESYLNFAKIPERFKQGRDPFIMMLGRIAGFSLSNPSSGATASGNSNVRVSGGGSAGSGSVISGTGGIGGAVGQPQGDPMFRVPTLRKGPYQGTPLILIDNVPVSFDAVYDLRASEIDYVEVYKSASAAVFGVNGFNGAIAFYTLKGEKMFKNQEKSFDVLSANGYHAAREFYAPKYDDSNDQKFIPDERSTLFWAPMITTDAEGKARVQFYTHDKNTNVFIDIQGISKNGITGTGVSRFNIRKNL